MKGETHMTIIITYSNFSTKIHTDVCDYIYIGYRTLSVSFTSGSIMEVYDVLLVEDLANLEDEDEDEYEDEEDEE